MVSQNPFNLLVDDESSRPSKKAAEKPAPKQAPKAGSTRRNPLPTGNEAALRDREAGAENNRRKPTGDNENRGRGQRGGRGGRFPRNQDDRHAKNNLNADSEKQTAAAWGPIDGEAELKDEVAAQEIADADKKASDDEEAEPVEEEPKAVTFEDFLAQKANKKLALGASLNIRQANDDVKVDQLAGTKPFQREEAVFADAVEKKQRQREAKTNTKQVLQVDTHEEPREERRGGGNFRGQGRGEGRGPRGEGRGPRGPREGGEGRGPRGAREGGEGRGPRGAREGGAPRGEGRGPRGAREGGAPRGGAEGRGGAPRDGAKRGGEGRTGGPRAPAINDESAFPTLGR